ncbi:hypothetical protein HVTV-2_gp145 [Haloarcula virus HVTV-2]|uniref:Uncharacterized protein n=1 Tax=Haloarcula vallismortis tailed virus 1 TaxID=1262528 RepID=L7TJF3_9CAUD|nr:hypothetical protein HVTV1_144 [Haloarcula vallismortis tailed virus 1]AGC34513.1 hypothetical protein HVTV1_144 [Haloarcula vallismortis tailed virus 1]UBF22952.1 hypothetical protein HVTV-2_gp145 [Haloarcula virus HVTV-2]
MEDQQETMESLTDEPMVDLDVDPDTGEFSILTGDELLRARYTRWSDNDYGEQFWDARCPA